jgi:hypothetical protein
MATTEDCSSCGEDTAPGGPLFSERRRIDHPDGSRDFLCPMCDRRVSRHHGKRLSDEELASFIRSGALAMIAWQPGGH